MSDDLPIVDLAEQKAVILDTLQFTYPPDDPLALRVAEAIAKVYKDAPTSEWERIAAKYQASFGLAEEVVVERLGFVPSGSAAPTSITARPAFETLVPDGWFARYLDWTSEHESPAQYHFGSAAAAIAAGLGRAPILDWEARKTYPNLYVLLVGPSGARKGSAIERAVSVVRSTLGTHVLPTEGTAQGFAAALRRRYKDTGLQSDGLIVSAEFNVLVSKSKHKEDLVTWLTDWYDSPEDWERGLRGEQEYRLTNICLSILGGSNMDWLKRMPEDAVTGGFLPRFIVFDAADKRFWKARPQFSRAGERELQSGLARIIGNIPDKIGFNLESEEYMDRWYETDLRAQYEATSDERFQKWISRKQAAVMKLAIVWQLADNGPRDALRVKWLHQARKVVDWGDVSVAQVYRSLGVTKTGEVNEAVLRYIEQREGRSSGRALMRAMCMKFNRAQVEEALRTLVAAGMLEQTRSVIEGIVWKTTGRR